MHVRMLEQLFRIVARATVNMLLSVLKITATFDGKPPYTTGQSGHGSPDLSYLGILLGAE